MAKVKTKRKNATDALVVQILENLVEEGRLWFDLSAGARSESFIGVE